MNWYDITVKTRVVKYDVVKTERRFILSNCDWTREKLLAVLTPLAVQEGTSGLEITEFALSSEADFAASPVPRRKYDLDHALGI